MKHTMINCDDFDNQLNAFIRDGLGVDAHIAMRDHVVGCSACAQLLQERKAYLNAVCAVKAPALSPNKSAQLLANAVEQGKKRSPAADNDYGFIKGFIAASVLAVAVFIGFNQYQTLVLNNKPQLVEHSIPIMPSVSDSREITLIIHSPQKMEAAQLVIQLPVELSIAGEEHLSEVEYIVDLQAGENRFVLPIVPEPYAMYVEDLKLSASLLYKNSKKDFELDIDLTTPQKSAEEPSGTPVG